MNALGHFPLTLSMPTWTLQWPVYIGYADTHAQSDCALQSAPFLWISVEFVVKITEMTYSVLLSNMYNMCSCHANIFPNVKSLFITYILYSMVTAFSGAYVKFILCMFVCVCLCTHMNCEHVYAHACLCTPHILVYCVCHQHNYSILIISSMHTLTPPTMYQYHKLHVYKYSAGTRDITQNPFYQKNPTMLVFSYIGVLLLVYQSKVCHSIQALNQTGENISDLSSLHI